MAALGVGKEDWNRLQFRTSDERAIHESLRVLERLARTGTPCLSADGLMPRLETRLCEKLATLRADWSRLQEV